MAAGVGAPACQTMRPCRPILLLFACCMLGGSGLAIKRAEIDFEYVDEEAKAAFDRKYRSDAGRTPNVLKELDYDEYREIHFRHDQTLWLHDDSKFRIQFYHLGYLYDEPVELHEFTESHVQRIPYLSDFFAFNRSGIDRSFRSSLGFAGFKVLYPIKGERTPYLETVSFLGASYFRGVGQGTLYGLSARAIAVDSGLGKEEEFPRFEEFWLGKPEPGQDELRVYGLLNGPRVVGAYQFDIAPGDSTVMKVKARIRLREPVESLGLIPLTSMFYKGENTVKPDSDYRPEVHDSDGLLFRSGAGETLWRPLDTMERTRLSYFRVERLEGMGLMQRDRDYRSYHDLESNYQLRSSAWIEPAGDWGPGVIKLVELPHNGEFDDNIVALWEPDAKPEPGVPMDFEYTLRWTGDLVPYGEPTWVPVSTRRGLHPYEEGIELFVIEFAHPNKGAGDGVEPPGLDASLTGPSELKRAIAQWNPQLGTWRVTLYVEAVAPGSPAIELRAQLGFGEGERSEVWSYQWTP